ncbi:MAG TPA: GerMN domain-containing protein [Acidimicrobiales bacterium]|nr:GerMN domain-containing protein [Acidimicrobiales bacterium]
MINHLPSGRRPRRIALILALAGLIGMMAAGCGIPTSSGPQAIAKGNVPSRLLNPGSTPTSTTLNPPPVATVTEEIYLVDPTLHLTPRNRNIAPPANLTQIVNALLLGPTASESAEGIQSFITGISPLSGSNRAVVTVANGIATVDFAANPVQVVGATQTLLAIAQVVFTVTQQPNVTGVLFQIAGQPIEVPIGPNGALVPGPVNQSQYPAQAPVTSATP